MTAYRLGRGRSDRDQCGIGNPSLNGSGIEASRLAIESVRDLGALLSALSAFCCGDIAAAQAVAWLRRPPDIGWSGFAQALHPG